jgi:hypothetical protein
LLPIQSEINVVAVQLHWSENVDGDGVRMLLMEVAYRLDFAVCNNNNNSGAALNVSRVKGK